MIPATPSLPPTTEGAIDYSIAPSTSHYFEDCNDSLLTQENGCKWRLDSEPFKFSRVKVGDDWIVAPCQIEIGEAARAWFERENCPNPSCPIAHRWVETKDELADIDLFSPVVKAQPVRVAPFSIADGMG